MRIRHVLITALAAAAAITALGLGATATADPLARQPASGRAASAEAANPAVAFGDCALTGVTCKPQNVSGTCSGTTSQTTPPTTIKVLVRTGTKAVITTVPFENYVEDVLPNEWIESWDLDALKAGAIAVKSYAWYWTNHFGGYLGATPTSSDCFDVTDDENFQVYVADSHLDIPAPRSTEAVQDTWPFVARRAGVVFQAGYRGTLTGSPTEACGAGANGGTLSQWGSQNCVEASTGNKFNVILEQYYGPGLQLTTARQQRTPHDFTFEQTSTRATFDPSGHWALDDGYGTTFKFGLTGDLPFTTDDGDGFAHLTVFRPSNSTWYIAGPTGAQTAQVKWGLRGDVPVPGHWAGLGHPSVLAVYRPSTQTWYVQGSPAIQYGRPGDVPVPGDYNGDGTTDIAVYRPSTHGWYIRGAPMVHYGLAGDILVPADYTGDGATDIAVYRPSNETWYVRGQATPVQFGHGDDIPVTGDFAGDRRIDFAVYRPSTHVWYAMGRTAVRFGADGVTPIGQAPYRG